ncbi:MAG: hypothetical protein F6K00_11090 [Leptolyngbya sp. SIOISBB]|nr:hypothetical protein [Leptolyngbya sp. SIOISBB]
MLIFKVIDLLTTRTLDRLGDWNPQLLRELKGRLKGWSVLTAIGLSLLVQVLLLLGFASALPGAIEARDLDLTTYPQINWSYASQLPTTVQAQVLPTGPVGNVIRAKGLFISSIATQEPVWGESTMGATALPQLQVGDRLVALDGVPIAQLETDIKTQVSDDPNAIWTDQHTWAHQDNVSTLVRGANISQLSPDRRSLINSTVELTLERPGRGQVTVAIPRVAIATRTPNYCLTMADGDYQQCQLSADKEAYLVNWPLWYQDIFMTLSGLMTLSLMGLGIFLLTNNVVDEKRRGTLNFLRMSPRSALTILGGKLLGVPICLYLAIAAMVPFQIYAAFAAGMPGAQLLGFDVAILSQTVILYGVALLLGLATKSPLLLSLIPWLAALGGLTFQWLVGVMSLAIWDSDMPATALTWAALFSPVGSAGYFINFDHLAHAPSGLNLAFGIFRINFAEYTILTVLHAGGWCVVLGHALQRRFENSSQSLLTRRYSYWLTGIFMAIVLGLSETGIERYDVLPLLASIAFFGGLYSLVLVLSLLGDRQTLQDWARFRTARLPHEGRLPLGRDLLVGDTSSPILAIGLNLLLMAALFIVWLMFYHQSVFSDKLDVVSLVGSLLILVGSVFFAVLASQVLLLAKRQKSWIWFSAVSSMSCLCFPALTLAIGMGLVPASLSGRNLWGLPTEIAMFAIPLSLLGSMTVLLAGLHWRQLILVGRSEYQQLLAAEPAQ